MAELYEEEKLRKSLAYDAASHHFRKQMHEFTFLKPQQLVSQLTETKDGAENRTDDSLLQKENTHWVFQWVVLRLADYYLSDVICSSCSCKK